MPHFKTNPTAICHHGRVQAAHASEEALELAWAITFGYYILFSRRAFSRTFFASRTGQRVRKEERRGERKLAWQKLQLACLVPAELYKFLRFLRLLAFYFFCILICMYDSKRSSRTMACFFWIWSGSFCFQNVQRPPHFWTDGLLEQLKAFSGFCFARWLKHLE